MVKIGGTLNKKKENNEVPKTWMSLISRSKYFTKCLLFRTSFEAFYFSYLMVLFVSLTMNILQFIKLNYSIYICLSINESKNRCIYHPY